MTCALVPAANQNYNIQRAEQVMLVLKEIIAFFNNRAACEKYALAQKCDNDNFKLVDKVI